MSTTTEELCTLCKKAPGTERWAQDALALARGWTEMRCRRCVVTEQLRHARECAARIPELERELEALEETR